jgi:hypothetical protein
MASNIVFNGVTYSIPAEGDFDWGPDLTAYFISIASNALQKTGGTFTLTAEANFGATYGLKSAYLKSQASNPSSAGIVRLGNTEGVYWRNAANNADLGLIVNASDALLFNSKTVLFSGLGLIVNADVSASAAIAYSKLNLTGSIVNADISASAAIAYSKLNLATSIVNADISASAAIVYSKLSLTGSIVNADVSASAAIAYSKLNLAGSIVNADISASAAIAYSKLNLASSIVNADINASAAIAYSKLAALTASRALVSDGSGFVSVSAVTSAELGYVSGVTSAIQTQLDAKQARSTLTTKGDIYVATASGVVARQAVGSNGQVIVADSAQTNGIKYQTLDMGTYTPTSGFGSGVPAASIRVISVAMWWQIGNKVIVKGGAYFRNDSGTVDISWSLPVTNGGGNVTNIGGEMRRSAATGETTTTRSRLTAGSNSSNSTIKWTASGISTAASDGYWEYEFTYTLA